METIVDDGVSRADGVITFVSGAVRAANVETVFRLTWALKARHYNEIVALKCCWKRFDLKEVSQHSMSLDIIGPLNSVECEWRECFQQLLSSSIYVSVETLSMIELLHVAISQERTWSLLIKGKAKASFSAIFYSMLQQPQQVVFVFTVSFNKLLWRISSFSPRSLPTATGAPWITLFQPNQLTVHINKHKHSSVFDQREAH